MELELEAKPPSAFWTLVEGRAMLEIGAFGLLRNRMRTLPKGDGHPVLFLPGFMGSDVSTKPMRSLFDDLEYNTFGWGLGRNLRFNEARELEMFELVERIYKEQKRSISIVGWSLGGVFARELAKQVPGYVRSVISLGSPISDAKRNSAVGRIFEAINGKQEELDPGGRLEQLDVAPPVPTTSIFSKTDGIVSWRGSIQCPTKGDMTENIIVPASHMGLGLNPLVMLIIADRLSQQEGEWSPFEHIGWRERVFRDPLQDAV